MRNVVHRLTDNYRIELDRLFQYARWRAAIQTDSGNSSSVTWAPDPVVVNEQNSKVNVMLDSVFEIGEDVLDDPDDLWPIILHNSLEEHVREFLQRLSINHNDVVCIQGGTFEYRQLVGTELSAYLSREPVAMPIILESHSAESSTSSIEDDSETMAGGSVTVGVKPTVRESDPTEISEYVTTYIGALSEPELPIVDFRRFTRSDLSTAWGQELLRGILAACYDSTTGAMIHLPMRELDGSVRFILDTYTQEVIDIRQSNRKTEAKVPTADQPELAENWWHLGESA